MLQAIMTAPGKIEFNEVKEPTVGKNQVKINIKSIGVCGSDVHVNHGQHPYTNYPVVQGHEVAGEIVELGSDVKGFSVGDKVTVQPQVVCGKCYPCRTGEYNNCEELKVMGFQTTGMASEYFVVDSEKVLVLPKSMSLEKGALIEPLAVAVHAVQRVESVKEKNVLVLGGGPIGNLVAQTAKALGAKKVVISELSKKRLQFADQCGINVINPNEESLTEGIVKQFGEDKADYIFECVGIEPTINQALDVARKGSSIIVVGVFGDKPSVNMGYVQDHELSLLGSAMYVEQDFLKAIELIDKELIELDTLITHRFDFKDYMEAYNIIDNDKDNTMKVMIEL